jgi:AraC-like DNA-binding protein
LVIRPTERAKFWLVEDLGGLELLRATYVAHSFSRHAHEGFAIGVVEDGAQAFRYRGATHTTPPGGIILVNPGEAHTGHAADELGYTYRMLYPDAKLLRRAASELAGGQGDVPFFPAPVVHDGRLAGLIRELHVTLESSNSTLERESLLLWTLAQLVARHADSRRAARPVGKEHAAIRRAREYLEAHHAENVSLERLSRVANLSPFHLLRVFRDETGLPPHAYVIGVRVARAKDLLVRGLPIARVAAETGFVDQSHFTKSFKRLWGYTPGEYAKALGKQQ